jgi:broad specificity polyphosphatase/5'/3'-nucleotidase SurE
MQCGVPGPVSNPGADVERLFQRMITITPLKYDLTDHAALARWITMSKQG